MTEVETQILKNQIEILWTLRHLLECAKPDLVGRAGALDRMRDDLAGAAKESKQMLDSAAPRT